MGKTRPTIRDLIDEWNTKWDHYARALRTAEDEAALNDVRGFVREYAMAANAHNPPRIEDEIVWLNIAIGQQRELNDLQDRITELEEHVAETSNDTE